MQEVHLHILTVTLNAQQDFLESVAKDNMNVKSDSLHMLGHLVRTKKHIEKATPKAILRTSGGLVQTVMAHFHSSCIGAPADMAVGGPKARRQGCPVVWVEEDLGHLAHYRNGCNRDQQPVGQYTWQYMPLQIKTASIAYPPSCSLKKYLKLQLNETYQQKSLLIP